VIEKEISAMANNTVEQLPADSIISRPQIRERFDAESLAGQMQTIKEVGVDVPLLVQRVDGKLIVPDRGALCDSK
jgi:ParB-like chromosome segregation protein Spo0J